MLNVGGAGPGPRVVLHVRPPVQVVRTKKWVGDKRASLWVGWAVRGRQTMRTVAAKVQSPARIAPASHLGNA